MASHLCISVRFLDSTFHGRSDGGAQEWPPSPLRVFQSLVAAAARKSGNGNPAKGAIEALKWLEGLSPPIIVAPRVQLGQSRGMAVPNNDLDVLAEAWSKGREPRKQANELKTMKSIRPAWLLEPGAVHYLWPIDGAGDEVGRNASRLDELARSIASLGWGIDMAIGHGRVLQESDSNGLGGERWIPTTADTGERLRTPLPGTLDALVARHERFVERLSDDGFTSPPPLSAFHVISYRNESEPLLPRYAAFSLLNLDASQFRAFDPARRGLTVAAMLRHAVRRAAEKAGWPEAKVNSFVLGHADSGESGSVNRSRRFAYIPLPSIEWRREGSGGRAGGIRRVLVVCFDESGEFEVAWTRRFLSGMELMQESNDPHPRSDVDALNGIGHGGSQRLGRGTPVALLSLIPSGDRVVRQYTEASSCWATVTPVVLPGYDDPAHYRRRLAQGTSAGNQRQLIEHLDERVDGLLRKAMRQAGIPTPLADRAEIDWSAVGFWPGTELAGRYGTPKHLRRFPRYHVRIQWRDGQGKPLVIPGPICIGGGRFYGLGLFARMIG